MRLHPISTPTGPISFLGMITELSHWQLSTNILMCSTLSGHAPLSVSHFIDCTICQMCLPGIFQELVYTGYKKYHGMKFQGLVMQNGLLIHLNGPYHTPQNDLGSLTKSSLLMTLEQCMIQLRSDEGDPLECQFFQIYDDSAYWVSPLMASPYSGVGELTVVQWDWNAVMGSVQISIEHGFGLICKTSYISTPSGSRRCGGQPVGYGIR